MLLTSHQFFELLNGVGPEIIHIANLPGDLAEHLNTIATAVQIERSYVIKVCDAKHRLDVHDFALMQHILEHGRVVKEGKEGKDGHLSFYYPDNRRHPNWLKLVIKTTNHGHQLWVATFHPKSPAEVKASPRKHQVIRW